MITVHSLQLVNRSEDLSRAGTMKGAEAEGLLGQSSGVESCLWQGAIDFGSAAQ